MRWIGFFIVAVFLSVSVASAAPSKKRGRRPAFSGHNATKVERRSDSSGPLSKPSGEIWVRAENLDEEVVVNIYNEDGSLNDGSLAMLDELFRCARTGEVRAVRRELYEHLSRIYDYFGKRRIDLVSGFRFAERDSSRHFHASAMDIKVEGTSIRDMYRYAQSLDGGKMGMGIGIYPRSGFVHLDFRAPGEPSYRWTDYSSPGNGKSKKRLARKAPPRKPTA